MNAIPESPCRGRVKTRFYVWYETRNLLQLWILGRFPSVVHWCRLNGGNEGVNGDCEQPMGGGRGRIRTVMNGTGLPLVLEACWPGSGSVQIERRTQNPNGEMREVLSVVIELNPPDDAVLLHIL